MSPSPILVDLPDDILYLIFPFLEPWEFLSLCAVNRHMHTKFQKASGYWRVRTLKTFRVPVRPLFHPDGLRWYWLYKTLSTKTRLYRWGPSDGSYSMTGQWPAKMKTPREIANVADAQCGEWSTSILTSDGNIYLKGALRLHWSPNFDFQTLEFPAGFRPTSRDLYEPATAISQFSSGSTGILGLSDDGRIWCWNDQSMPGYQIQFANVDIAFGPQDLSRPGTVTKVVCGSKYDSVFDPTYDSAYVTGTGILYWEQPWETPSDLTDDGVLTELASIIPGTSSRLRRSLGSTEVAHPMGEVINYVVLKEHIVFIKDTNKAFATQLDTGATAELPKFSAPGRILVDIQGAYGNFAVFTASGEVLLGNTATIQRIPISPSLYENSEIDIEPSAPPSLQHTDVVAIAFGRCHCHALHANGKISAHVLDPRAFEALGFGSRSLMAPFRSFKDSDARQLCPHAVKYPFAEKSSSPQYVWFEPEKEQWLGYLSRRLAMTLANSPGWYECLTLNSRGLLENYSKCIERQGETWGDFPEVKEQDPDGLGAYFAISIAAGGSQSVALVLVNDDLAKQIKDKHVLEYNSGIEPWHLLLTESPPGKAPPIKYHFELGDFPVPHLSETGDIDPNRYDFSTWKYGFPEDCFRTPNRLPPEARDDREWEMGFNWNCGEPRGNKYKTR
ncbi:hypothetical protein GX51_02199 [Blastomyces parvus]|uniref:F-box domain-containing protein n=1 Tax=Blastomyces parvus TaxID=2060905 RepID=A0A2B7XDN0_9EURO|nr:hypothetical protein GX51_02199 [Blastomyces parvus]